MDMQLPRPYDNRWMIQGTRGRYNEQRDAVYLAGGFGNYLDMENAIRTGLLDREFRDIHKDSGINLNTSEAIGLPAIGPGRKVLL